MRRCVTLLFFLLVPACFSLRAQAQTIKPATQAPRATSPLNEQLMDRLRHRDAAGVKALLKRGANPNWPDSRGELPLFEAAHRGLGIVQLLIAAGANPRALGFQGNTLLHEAVNDPQTVRFLLQHGFNVNARNHDLNTPLILAAEAGNLESAQLLLNAGANASAVARDGMDALMRAIPHNNVTLVRLLEQNGASFKGIETFALISAAGASATQMLRYLTSRKFSFKVRDDEGRPPLIVCIMSNDAAERGEDADTAVVPAIKALLAGGADVNQADTEFKRTPLHWAAAGGQDAIVETLLKAGANPNRFDDMGQLPIEEAIWEEEADKNSFGRIAQLLLRAGTRFDLPNPFDGRTSLMNLAANNQVSWLERAAKSNPHLKVNTQGRNGETALMLAAERGAVDAAKWLLKAGANPQLHDNQGHSALDYINQPITIVRSGFTSSPRITSAKDVQVQAEDIIRNRMEIKKAIEAWP